MGGRGSSSGKSKGKGTSMNTGSGKTKLSNDQTLKINNNVKTHSKEDNDRAERNILGRLNKEKDIVNNLDKYIRLGTIKSANDEWFKGHVESYNFLKAQYKEFLKARKKHNK